MTDRAPASQMGSVESVPHGSSQRSGVGGSSGGSPIDKAAFAGLFRTEASYVGHSLRRLGVREADLEDLTHEVFLVVHRIWPSYDPSRPLRPWLFGIAFRIASDYRRTAYVARELATDTSELDPPARLEDDPEKEAERRRTRTRILGALDAVAIDRRAVFILHEIDRTPVPEIATALSIPLNTAYSRLRLARGEFKDAFARLSRENTGGGSTTTRGGS